MSKNSQLEKPKIIEGGLAIDARGQVMFVNNFNFKGIKRFYAVSNHSAGFVRAWHGHKKEAKYALVVSGAAILGAVAINNWKKPSKNTKVHRYVLSAELPQILYIPPGYANGFMSLTQDTQLIFFSTSTLKQSLKDDLPYPSHYWDIWQLEKK